MQKIHPKIIAKKAVFCRIFFIIMSGPTEEGFIQITLKAIIYAAIILILD